MSERRRNTRQKSFLRGFVSFDKRRGVMDCLIRDLADDGARMIFSESVTIPDVLNLHTPQTNLTLRARVEWRRGEEIGLGFVAVAASEPPQPSDLTDRIAQLEDEIAALRQVLKRLKGDKPGTDDEVAA